LPLAAIIEKWRSPSDRVIAAFLTHPHRDHADGFSRLVDALRPEYLGIVGPTGTDPVKDALDWISKQKPSTGKDDTKIGAVRAALTSIVEAHRRKPSSLLLLNDSVTLPSFGRVAIEVLAPNDAKLLSFTQNESLPERFRRKANWASLACLVSFGRSQILLGGDLPTTSNGQLVPTGWEEVASRRASLSNHGATKVPHHGSKEAFHAVWMDRSSNSRCWWITPYNSSELPELAAGEGLDQLLAAERVVRLTALPAARHLQADQPTSGRVKRSQVGFRRDSLKTGIPFVDEGIDIKPGSACEPLDAVWVGQFDSDGNFTNTWRGSAALEIERDEPTHFGVTIRRKS
jgi:hypothetical protein